MTRDHERDPETGTVLLTTLLVMALMATLAVALMDDIRLAVKRTQTVDAYAQADWQLRGAQAFVTAWVANDYKALPVEAKTALLLSPDPLILPTPGGAVTVRLRDASQCFNLNAVVNEAGVLVPLARVEFQDLMSLLGLPTSQAESLSYRLADWMDADTQRNEYGAEDGTYLRRTPPYRTANTALTSVDELLAVDGMDAETFALLRPFICVGAPGVRTPVNVNTLPPERLIVLAAALNGDTPSQLALSLLETRGARGFESKSDVLDSLTTLTGEAYVSDRLDVISDAIFAEVTVTQTQGATTAERVRVFRYDRLDTDTPKLTYRGWGRAAFLPDVPDPDDADEGTN